jgi:hypothetical protein
LHDGEPLVDTEPFKMKLQPDAIHAGLVRAGLFLAGWELLKAEIVDGVQAFFVDGFDEKRPTVSHEYTTQVLQRHRSRFEASILWLVEADALDSTQADQVRSIHAHRNEVAHELPKLLIEPGRGISADLLSQMHTLLRVLGRFWGGVEVDTDSRFDEETVDRDQIQSGAMLLMQHLIEVASAATANGTSGS